MIGKEQGLVNEVQQKYYNLEDRLLTFSVRSLQFLKTLPDDIVYNVIKYQFSKSATSIGANYKESQNTTYKEFIVKIRIAVREANESQYWIQIINKMEIGSPEQINFLMDEIEELLKILGSILAKVSKNIKS